MEPAMLPLTNQYPPRVQLALAGRTHGLSVMRLVGWDAADREVVPCGGQRARTHHSHGAVAALVSDELLVAHDDAWYCSALGEAALGCVLEQLRLVLGGRKKVEG